MASSAPPLLLLTLSLLALSATARPCKTLFFYTTTTTSSSSFFPTSTTSYFRTQNPNLNLPNFPNYPSFSSPKFVTFFFTTTNTPEIVPSRPTLSFRNGYLSLRRYPFPRFFDEEKESDADRRSADAAAATVMPVGFYSSVTRSSIRDRTRDIMSVVGALLFGVGCGALTAATMYLIWSLVSPTRFDLDESDDDGFDVDGDDDVTPKKVGYVAIPDEDISAIKAAAQAKAKATAV